MQLLKATLTDETIQTFSTIANDLNIISGLIGLDKSGKATKYIKQAEKNLEELLSPRCELQHMIEEGHFTRDVYLQLRETLSNLDILRGETEPSQVWFMEKIHKPFMDAFCAVAPDVASRIALK